ncbi:MAG: prepilin-type N-terminal cleavage/methylation domain-containing protein [Candidatus Omnitrophica bacterium]|nr:prepilin-type N-terminal cleavage/methylation domain-containing protein [Candidatus Omnitrophota bacterium]
MKRMIAIWSGAKRKKDSWSRLFRDRTTGGFTVLEVVIAIVIIGIISAIAIPTINSMVQNSRIQVTAQNLAEIKKAIIGDPSIQFKGFRQLTGATPTDLNELWNIGAASVANLFPSIDRGQGNRAFIEQKVLNDPWDREIVIGTTTAGRKILISRGSDGAFDSPQNNYDPGATTNDIILVLPDE